MKFAIIGCNSEDAITYPHHTEVVTTPYGNARVIHATLPNGKEVDFLTRHSVCLQATFGPTSSPCTCAA